MPGIARFKLLRPLLAFAALLGLALALQWENGAYRSDFGGHADEGAHVVTSLMVRDYLAGPLWRGRSPLAYAREYYDRFPKVALGHYPPAYYLLQGIWLLPWRNATMILAFSALVTAATALLVCLLGRPLLGNPAALLAAAVFCLFRIVQTYTAVVMSDMLLALACLGATACFARFLQRPGVRWSLAFGLLASLAILTKGSGLLLALVPPLSIALTRRWNLLRDWRLWLAPIPVAVLALPWMAATAGITSEGMADAAGAAYFKQALPYYLGSGAEMFGVLLSLILITAFGWEVSRLFLRREPPRALPSALWALLLAVFAFLPLVPSGLDERYLLPALAPAILLGASFLRALAGRLAPLSSRLAAAPSSLVVCLPLALAAWERHQCPDKDFTGPARILSRVPASLIRPAILVSSDANGEGALVAEAALHPARGWRILRASKLLAASDWLGRGYELKFASAAALRELLARAGVDLLAVDDSIPEDKRVAHHQLLQALLDQPDAPFPVLAREEARRRVHEASITLYRVPAGAPPG